MALSLADQRCMTDAQKLATSDKPLDIVEEIIVQAIRDIEDEYFEEAERDLKELKDNIVKSRSIPPTRGAK